jgi:hypothetical protein
MARKKIGRPPSENSMRDRLFVYVDKTTKEKLNECAEIMKTTRSDVVRKGIHRMHDDLKK